MDKMFKWIWLFIFSICSIQFGLSYRAIDQMPILEAWKGNHMLTQVWEVATYPVPNFNEWTVEVW